MITVKFTKVWGRKVKKFTGSQVHRFMSCLHLENYYDCEKCTPLQLAALLAKSTRVRRNKSLIVVMLIGQ